MTLSAPPAAVAWGRGHRPGAGEIEAIAFADARVELSADLLDALSASHAATLAALGTADPVYGVTTGQGHFADRALSGEEAAEHQRNLLLDAPSARRRGCRARRRARCWPCAWPGSRRGRPG